MGSRQNNRKQTEQWESDRRMGSRQNDGKQTEQSEADRTIPKE